MHVKNGSDTFTERTDRRTRERYDGPDTYSADEIDLYMGGQKIEPFTAGKLLTHVELNGLAAPRGVTAEAETRIRAITDAEAAQLGLATDEAAKVGVDELMALLGADLCAIISARSSKLPKHIQMIAARVALEQHLDPVVCLNDLDATLERMGTDSAFGDSIRTPEEAYEKSNRAQAPEDQRD